MRENIKNDFLRYQETLGEKPTNSQIGLMIQISRDLDQKDCRGLKSPELDYLKRQDGDALFREKPIQDRSKNISYKSTPLWREQPER